VSVSFDRTGIGWGHWAALGEERGCPGTSNVGLDAAIRRDARAGGSGRAIQPAHPGGREPAGSTDT
jgi:hypothetical protein